MSRSETSIAPDGARRIRTYEELDGATGRAVFFRPHRYCSTDLLPLRGVVTVRLAGTDHEIALRDVRRAGSPRPVRVFSIASDSAQELYELFGELLVANMVDHPTRWLMEMHLDWSLVYRTREALLDIGRHAAPEAHSRILEEESGVNPFLALSRE